MCPLQLWRRPPVVSCWTLWLPWLPLHLLPWLPWHVSQLGPRFVVGVWVKVNVEVEVGQRYVVWSVYYRNPGQRRGQLTAINYTAPFSRSEAPLPHRILVYVFQPSWSVSDYPVE
jgi:hypothetical protein